MASIPSPCSPVPIPRTLAVATLAAIAVLAAGSAHAQAAPPNPAAESTLETVVVTGSRINRPELAATAPTVSIGADVLANQGSANIADVATQLPQFAPSFGTSRTQSTFAGADASGLNLANLRNAGSIRTVVLINGRRVPGGTSTTTEVDFNTIPTANIDHIEISAGGASAIYGADAVAGVINIITKQNFSGVEVGASYGQSSRGDNTNPGGYLMFGGNLGERGHGLLTLQYDRQGRVSCANRYLCAEDFFWGSGEDPIIRGPAAYSGVGLNGRFFLPNGTSVTRVGNSLTDASGNLIPFVTAVHGFNRNPQRDLAIPTERIMLAAQGEYGVSDAVKAFAEINYGSADTNARFEGHPFQSQQAGSLFGGGPGVSGLQATIPVTNPFVPAALRSRILALDPAATQITWWQRLQLANRGATNSRDTIRAVAGFRGEIPSLGFGRDWTWEIHHVYGRTRLEGTTNGLVGTDRLYYGLRVEPDPTRPGQFRCTDPGARASGCVPVDPFAPYTPAMADYLGVSAGQHGVSKLQDSQAYVTGSLFDLPAGPLQAVLGWERRSFSGYLDYDEVINRALVTGNQIGDTDKSTILAKEAFTEVVVPVLKDLPAVKSLAVEGAYRHTDSNVGNYNTWKAGLNWEPLDGLRVRAMTSRAVRAPVPDELSGIGQTFGVVNDPCTATRRNANSTRAANCARDGVPANYAPPIVIEQGVAGFTGGNPNLRPEQSKSRTYGIVWTPRAVEGLSLSVDRFELDISGVITTVARQTAVNLCYDTPNRLFCNQVQRGTNPLLPGASYVLVQANEQQQNVAVRDVAGYDVQARYGFEFGRLLRSERDLGALAITLLATIYDRADLYPLPTERVKLLGAAGGSTDDQGYVRRQANLNLNWRWRAFSANWNMRYIGRATMTPFDDTFPEVGSHTYHNLRLALGFGDDSEVYVGVDNLFDRNPPFFGSGTSGTQALDTIPGYYDVFGRSWFGGVRLKF